MKPRLILLSAVFLECVLLFLIFSEKPDPNQPPPGNATAWRNDPTPEEERALDRKIAWEQWRPRLLWALLAANSAFALGYGVKRLRKRL
jgi:hypothetical protein